MASITTTAAAAAAASSFLHRRRALAAAASPPPPRATATLRHHHIQHHQRVVGCRAAEVSAAAAEEEASGDGNWVPVVPLAALPRGERRVIVQDGEEILLLWYKEQVYAVENRSPAEGAYTEGLLNAKLTQDGCIVCPTTDSTFDLRTGEIKEWYPNNPVLRALTPALRKLFVYPVKIDGENIYISIKGAVTSGGSAEIIFSGKAQPGFTASDVNIEEVRMVIDEDVGGFGFTNKNELINGKAAIIGFLLLIDFELLTGKGLLKGTDIWSKNGWEANEESRWNSHPQCGKNGDN
uniref:Rieske domain-containing protein n=1 Tax=Oryza glumipatula TaxID=40148 RepID=A0A0E0BH72_9ORYZ